MMAIAFDNPTAWAVAVLAVFVLGLAKGGLTGVGMLVVPVMALAISPVQAAAIVLPLLIVSDIISLRAFWREWDRATLAIMLPGAVAGIGVGWATAALVSPDVVRLIVGIIAVAFVLRWLWQLWHRTNGHRPQNAAQGAFWGGVAGYTSFVAHAGGPPYQVYTLPLGLAPRPYTGTNVAFFAIVNAVKLVPYIALGQFDATNLTTSALLAPVAVVATLAGAALITRMNAEVFYRITYALAFLVGLKLIWDGLAGLA